MKIWHSFGSEHSNNLVMIGHFKEVDDAEQAKKIIDRFTAKVDEEVSSGRMQIGEPNERFSDEMRKFLTDHEIFSLSPSELQQFGYEITPSLDRDNKQIVVTTEEYDVSAFLKILIDKGARVEIYSAHDYPGEGHGR